MIPIAATKKTANDLTTEESRQVDKMISRAKLALMTKESLIFFSALLTSLHLIYDFNRPTAGTNGVSLWMNPFFVLKQTQEKLLGLLLHEVLHVAFDHISTLYDSHHINKKVLNIAQDHYINLYILKLGFQIPDGGYCDHKFSGMSSMEIYHELMKDPPDTSEVQMDIEGAPEDTDPNTHLEAVLSNIIKAVQIAEQRGAPGSVPGDLRLKLEDTLNPKLPWSVILWQYLSEYAKDDYTWRRPNKRFMPQFYLPKLHNEKMHDIVSGLDVSGSMLDDISECMKEMQYIKDMLNPSSFHLMTFDTVMHHDKVYEQFERLPEGELPDGGAGGTIIEPLIATIKKEQPRFALIFTDGYFNTPSMDGIKSDIYWIIKSNASFEAPQGHGIVIHM